ncbi:unnamed protein product [Paramecium sonneborni]|uniref:Uncharacterized protein n=1 Tax=Paramecium sonneborni TaxID=65129 RepID=A0A8S1QV06_9CILI|nr:unnamed protein product [Paramecium sonneborni]
MRNQNKFINEEAGLRCYYNHSLPIIDVILDESWPENKRLGCMECPRVQNKKVESFESFKNRIQVSQQKNLDQYQTLAHPVLQLLQDFNNNVNDLKSDLNKKFNLLDQLSELACNFEDEIKQQTQQFDDIDFTKELDLLIQNDEQQYQEEKFLIEEKQFFLKFNCWNRETYKKIYEFQQYHHHQKNQKLLEKITQMNESLQKVDKNIHIISDIIRNRQEANMLEQQFEVVAYNTQNLKANLLIEVTQANLNYYDDGTLIKSENNCFMERVCQNMVQLQKLSWIGEYDQQKNKIGKWTAFWEGQQTKIGGYYIRGGQKAGKWIEMTPQYRDEMLVTFEGNYNYLGLKYGLWTYFLNEKIIGLGVYQINGLKEGEWIEIDENYNKDCQIILKGYYGLEERKQGKWVIYLKDEILFSSFYNSEGQKVDFWGEICGNFDQRSHTYIEGFYNDQGKKFGQWIIYQNQFRIGGGDYNKFGKKVGKWKEVDQNYQKESSFSFDDEDNQYFSNEIYYVGNYNEEGNKIGSWKIYEKTQEIGGGKYQQNGYKYGKWTELHNFYTNEIQPIMVGEYKYGQRFGEWNIWYKKNDEKIKIGGGCYGYNGKKIERWTELYTFTYDTKINQTILTYEGEYDQKGFRINEWKITSKLMQFHENIGGGKYNLNGMKIGYWQEIIIYFGNKDYIHWNGKYNIQGQKIGKWKIFLSYSNQIGGGRFDQNGIKYGKWIEFGNKQNCKFSSQEFQFFEGYYNRQGQKIGTWKKISRHILD